MIIYWNGYTEHDTISELKFEEPSLFLKNFKLDTSNIDNTGEVNFNLCPAFTNFNKNLYEIKFPVDYDLTFIKNKNKTTFVKSEMYDQKFFNEILYIRSLDLDLYSFNIRYLFFCEEDVEVSQFSPLFNDNDFSNKSIIIPGKFNIAKTYRPFDCAWKLKENVSSIKLKENDVVAYLKFYTNNKIQFKRFYRSEKLKNLQFSLFKLKSFKNKMSTLSYFYNVYEKIKIKKLILKEIKENLLH